MSSASLAVFHRAHPDRVRIAAMSAAIAFNLAVILVAARPITTVFVAPDHAPVTAQRIRLIEPPAVVKPPPTIVMKPLVHPPVMQRVHVQPLPASPPVAVPSTEGNVTAPPVGVPTMAPASAVPGPALDATPVEASLAYLSSPLRFPLQALRQHMQGSVLLRVLVDETGKPVNVVVERSSGYLLLDRSAREQVLASWRFQPAQVNGQAVRAWARVPVTFDLRAQ